MMTGARMRRSDASCSCQWPWPRTSDPNVRKQKYVEAPKCASVKRVAHFEFFSTGWHLHLLLIHLLLSVYAILNTSYKYADILDMRLRPCSSSMSHLGWSKPIGMCSTDGVHRATGGSTGEGGDCEKALVFGLKCWTFGTFLNWW